jgi:methylisocitrate lyase
VEAGADMIFAEALGTLSDFAEFARGIPVPVLANLTEFGVTPPLAADELGRAGIRLVLYPLSAFRAMSRAAEAVYAAIMASGTTQPLHAAMQTRDELYAVLRYLDYERKLDELFAGGRPEHDDDGSYRKPRT